MARSVHSITIPSATSSLEVARRFVETYARAADLADDTVEHFKIAVDEACTNVIKHSYKGDNTRQIDIACIVDPESFTVRIRDEGQSFQPDLYKEPDIFDLAKRRRGGGLGVHMMRRLMDRVEYRKRGKVNEVNLTKYRSGALQNGDVRQEETRNG